LGSVREAEIFATLLFYPMFSGSPNGSSRSPRKGGLIAVHSSGDNFSSFMKSMTFQRSGGFNNTVYRNVHGTVFIEVSHLENRVAKTMFHLVNF